MSKENLWTIVGRNRLDLAFSGDLQRDFDKALNNSGYQLDPGEREQARQAVASPSPQGFFAPSPADLQFQHQKMRERFSKQVDRALDLNAKAVEVVKQTFDNARSTYNTITWMNRIMFATGIGLFLFAAAYAAYAQQKSYALFFGGLGAANFVALFLLGPIDKTQKALSNLVQVEMAFMNYFDQITFWEGFASIPRGVPPAPDPANIEKASAMLQERCRETIELLQCYVEESDKTATHSSRRDRRDSASAPEQSQS